jgi:hypothetical protein
MKRDRPEGPAADAAPAAAAAAETETRPDNRISGLDLHGSSIIMMLSGMPEHRASGPGDSDSQAASHSDSQAESAAPGRSLPARV